mmetsp:Transcript_9010/g.28067  ORF Transcript_9010/g.28067 Transcript_9010/m.28067 type:complete len:228 (-) Transcript_9010:1581-2264(-)
MQGFHALPHRPQLLASDTRCVEHVHLHVVRHQSLQLARKDRLQLRRLGHAQGYAGGLRGKENLTAWYTTVPHGPADVCLIAVRFRCVHVADASVQRPSHSVVARRALQLPRAEADRGHPEAARQGQRHEPHGRLAVRGQLGPQSGRRRQPQLSRRLLPQPGRHGLKDLRGRGHNGGEVLQRRESQEALHGRLHLCHCGQERGIHVAPGVQHGGLEVVQRVVPGGHGT